MTLAFFFLSFSPLHSLATVIIRHLQAHFHIHASDAAGGIFRMLTGINKVFFLSFFLSSFVEKKQMFLAYLPVLARSEFVETKVPFRFVVHDASSIDKTTRSAPSQCEIPNLANISRPYPRPAREQTKREREIMLHHDPLSRAPYYHITVS